MNDAQLDVQETEMQNMQMQIDSTETNKDFDPAAHRQHLRTQLEDLQLQLAMSASKLYLHQSECIRWSEKTFQKGFTRYQLCLWCGTGKTLIFVHTMLKTIVEWLGGVCGEKLDDSDSERETNLKKNQEKKGSLEENSKQRIGIGSIGIGSSPRSAKTSKVRSAKRKKTAKSIGGKEKQSGKKANPKTKKVNAKTGGSLLGGAGRDRKTRLLGDSESESDSSEDLDSMEASSGDGVGNVVGNAVSSNHVNSKEGDDVRNANSKDTAAANHSAKPDRRSSESLPILIVVFPSLELVSQFEHDYVRNREEFPWFAKLACAAICSETERVSEKEVSCYKLVQSKQSKAL
jgi:hypothetical protein